MLMNNLFSMFEPTAPLFSSGLSFMMLLILMTGMIVKTGFYNTVKPIFMIINLNKEKIKSGQIIFCCGSMILFMNMMGLTPHTLCMSSHMAVNMPLALNMWLSMSMFYVFKKFKYIMAHLTPMSSPLLLSPILVVIEIISMIIQPMTLALRLTANMISGHMIISLLLMKTFVLGVFVMTLNILLSLPVMLLELGVAMIQTYVFIMLISLYISDK